MRARERTTARVLAKTMLAVTLAVTPTMTTLTPQPNVALAVSKTTTFDNDTKGMSRKEKAAYKKLRKVSKRSAYKENAPWSNAKSYMFRGSRMYKLDGAWYNGGHGCEAFALNVSDLVFGTKAAITPHRSLSRLKVGDIIRMDDDTHSAIVLKITKKKVVIAEGNYNRKVHWGRVITKSRLRGTLDYILTRY